VMDTYRASTHNFLHSFWLFSHLIPKPCSYKYKL
jgi:hypothetical protein